MKNCNTCVYWKELDNSDHRLKRDFTLGKCTMVVMYWDATEYVDGVIKLTDECKNQKAFVSDGSDYYAELTTLGDFGCVSYKEKD